MIKNNLSNTESHKHSVPENCPRINKLVLAHGEKDFLTEIVFVHFPEWNTTNIEQISQEKFHILEKKLEECAHGETKI